jgi:hypothetical protein
MNKILILGILLVNSLMGYAQKVDTLKSSIQKNAEAIGHGGNNELKVNLFFAVRGMPEISYERLLATNMGIGAAFFVGLDNKEKFSNQQSKFGFTPYYRIYFGAKKASGFFIEGNAILTSIYADYNNYAEITTLSMPAGYYNNQVSTRAHFGLGAAVGGKFLTRNGFLGEAYLGVNRLLSEKSKYLNDEAIARVGITIGKRFR